MTTFQLVCFFISSIANVVLATMIFFLARRFRELCRARDEDLLDLERAQSKVNDWRDSHHSLRQEKKKMTAEIERLRLLVSCVVKRAEDSGKRVRELEAELAAARGASILPSPWPNTAACNPLDDPYLGIIQPVTNTTRMAS